jgi:hypothetical protein
MSEFSSTFVKRYIDWVIRNRWLVIVVSVVSILLMASGARHLQFEQNYRIFFGPDNPQLLAFDEVEMTFSKFDSIIIIVNNPTGTIFNEETLLAVRELTDAGWQVPHSYRVDSLANYQHSWSIEDDLIVEELVPEGMESDADTLARAEQVVKNEPILAGNIANYELDTTVVVTRILLDAEDTGAVAEVAGAGRAMIETMRAKYPDLRFELTGPIMLSNAFGEAPEIDSGTVFPVMFLLIIILMAFFTRSFFGTIATLGVIFLSTAGAMGLAGFYGYGINPANIAAPVVILTLAIADSIHILLIMFKEMRHGKDKISALKESIRINAHPVFLTSLTTAIGFLVMNFSDAPPFHELGNMTATGVGLAWILSISFLPAVLAVMPIATPKGAGSSERVMNAIADFNIRHKKKLAVVVGGSIIFFVGSVARMEINDIPHQYFSSSTNDFRNATDFHEEKIGFYNYMMTIDSGSTGGINDPAYLESLDKLTAWLLEQPKVTHVGSFANVAKKLNMNMHGDDPSFRRVPEDRELAAQYLLLYELSLPMGLDLNDQIDVDKRSTRLQVSFKAATLAEIVDVGFRSKDWVAENTPGLTTGEPTGPPVMFALITRTNIFSMIRGTAFGFVLIAIILVVSLKNPVIGILSLIPNIVPAATAFGIWALVVGQAGFAISVVAGLSIGIIVDDTVHFLSKYSRARKELGLNNEDAVRYAFNTVGQALLSTSFIVSGGFAVLMLSSFKVTASMGALTSLTVVCALFADFLLLPALLILLDHRKFEAPSTPETAEE